MSADRRGKIAEGDWVLQGRYWVNRHTGQMLPVIQGGTNPNWVQEDFRFRNDDGTLVTATYMGTGNNQNQSINVDTVFRLRFVVQQTVSGKAVANQLFEIWVSKNSGAYVQATASSANAQLANDANSIADNNTTVQQIGNGTYVTGDSLGYNDGTTDATTGVIDFAGADEVEIECCLKIIGADVNNGDTLDFRIYLSGGTALNSYLNTPRATAVKVAPQPPAPQIPETDENFDAALGHDFRGQQAAPLAADVLPPTEQPAPELPEIDGAFEPYHPQYYEGQQSSPVEGTAVSVSWAWLQVPASVDFQAPREFPQVDESYDLPFDLESYGGWLARQFEEAAPEPQIPQPEAPAIDQGYDPDHGHDFTGWVSWATPTDIVEPYHLPETPIIDEAFDESQGHDFRGIQAGPLSADAEVQDFQPLAELPEVDGTFDATQGHAFDGWQTWQTPADVAVQPPVSSLPEFQPEPEADYSGWQAWQIPGDIAEPYHLPELPQVDESYDGTWLHDFDGWQTWQLPGDIVEPYHLPETPIIDEAYDETQRHDFTGWQAGSLSADALAEGFQPAPELPLVDEYYDQATGHDFQGWQAWLPPLAAGLEELYLFTDTLELILWTESTEIVLHDGSLALTLEDL